MNPYDPPDDVPCDTKSDLWQAGFVIGMAFFGFFTGGACMLFSLALRYRSHEMIGDIYLVSLGVTLGLVGAAGWRLLCD